MAGWVAVWSRTCAPLPEAPWSASARAAVRYGGAWQEWRALTAAVGAWRRPGGEFPQSGRLRAFDGGCAAWLGQCVEDSGDSSSAAADCLRQTRFDGAAAARLNGPFAFVAVRVGPFEVRAVTDRYRHYPIYFHRGPQVAVASTDIRTLLPWLADAALDPDSIDMFLRTGELIERSTLLKAVQLLPPGTCITDDGTDLHEHRYWALQHTSSDMRSAARISEDLGERLRTGVRRIERVTPRPGITLSGGLDSRMILDLCAAPEKVPSFTWGLPGCRDVRCARRYAAVAHVPHHVRFWDVAAFPPLWPTGVEATAGGFGVDSMYMLPFVPLLASACDVVLNGLAGDALLGGNFIKASWLGEGSLEGLAARTWRWRVPEADDQWADRLLSSRAATAGARERWTASISAGIAPTPIDRLNDWLYENRVFRYTNAGTALLRTGVESHAPFFDRDFVDAALAVPHALKFKHRLYLQVMKLVAPRAAAVPWQRTNLLPRLGFLPNVASMTVQRAAAALAAAFGFHVFPALRVADPAGWLRGPWARAAQGTLLGPRCRERGVFEPAAARDLLAAHAAGANHTRIICTMLAVELFARQAIDAEPPPQVTLAEPPGDLACP